MSFVSDGLMFFEASLPTHSPAIKFWWTVMTEFSNYSR